MSKEREISKIKRMENPMPKAEERYTMARYLKKPLGRRSGEVLLSTNILRNTRKYSETEARGKVMYTYTGNKCFSLNRGPWIRVRKNGLITFFIQFKAKGRGKEE